VRNALLGSSAVHVALALGLLVMRPSREILVPGPDVVQVGLIDAATAPSPPAPAIRSAPEAVTPAEDQGIRIEKPKEKAKPHPERQEKPKAAEPVPAPTAPASAASIVLPYASVGGGMRGQVAVDESNFEFAYYLQQLRTMIARNWTPTSGMPAGTRVEIYFRIARDGTLTSPRVEVSSGNAYFDQSAQRAVIITNHLPPLPLGYSGSDLGVHFGFEYSGS
jgi:TonB family protein